MYILREASSDKGLSIDTIVRNVYNMTNVDMFSARPFEDVKNDVVKYLHAESSIKGGIIEKTEQRGFYRLNRKSQTVKQLLLEFEISEEDEWMM